MGSHRFATRVYEGAPEYEVDAKATRICDSNRAIRGRGCGTNLSVIRTAAKGLVMAAAAQAVADLGEKGASDNQLHRQSQFQRWQGSAPGAVYDVPDEDRCEPVLFK